MSILMKQSSLVERNVAHSCYQHRKVLHELKWVKMEERINEVRSEPTIMCLHTMLGLRSSLTSLVSKISSSSG